MSLTLTTPDDMHLHLRDDRALSCTVPHTAAQFGRAVIMPNLVPPVTTADRAAAYCDRIQAAIPAGASFSPLMTLYLTDKTTADEIFRARDGGLVVACKLYPAGATTNSDLGVTCLEGLDPVLNAMAETKMPLLVH
ncbi:MAG: amidohydrolase family protein, partial [bacterium]|nr:amidohydrolase family protein [bacterium]